MATEKLASEAIGAQFVQRAASPLKPYRTKAETPRVNKSLW
jgi:hypothetical protein